MKKLLTVFFVLLFAGSFVSAQGSDLGDRLSGESVKEKLLSFKPIARLDALFQKINPVFVFLFSRDYSFSLGMLFVFVFWMAAFIVLSKFFDAFFDKFVYSLLSTLAGTVVIAWLQIFNVAVIGVEFVRGLNESTAFGFFVWLLFFASIYFGWMLGWGFAGGYAKEKKEDRVKDLEKRVESEEGFIESFIEAAS